MASGRRAIKGHAALEAHRRRILPWPQRLFQLAVAGMNRTRKGCLGMRRGSSRRITLAFLLPSRSKALVAQAILSQVVGRIIEAEACNHKATGPSLRLDAPRKPTKALDLAGHAMPSQQNRTTALVWPSRALYALRSRKPADSCALRVPQQCNILLTK